MTEGPAHVLPERAADETLRTTTLQQSALLYRLSGDDNPLHADPHVARAAGFARPILHGLCTLATVAFALCRRRDDGADAFVRLRARFTGVVYPGEELATELWRDGSHWSFRTRVEARNATVLDLGLLQWAQ